jgi:hypothetical protein
MSAERNRAALGAAVEAWNRGDQETYLKVYDPAIRHYGLGPEPLDQAANRGSYEALWGFFLAVSSPSMTRSPTEINSRLGST